MKNPELENLKIRVSELEEQLEEGDVDDLKEKVYQLEREINIQKHTCFEGEYVEYDNLFKIINQIKKDYDFYDKESAYDYMFPNRHDPDFDEDSMSYDSVIGDD